MKWIIDEMSIEQMTIFVGGWLEEMRKRELDALQICT